MSQNSSTSPRGEMFTWEDVFKEYTYLAHSPHCDKIALVMMQPEAITLTSQCRLSDFSKVYLGYLMKALCRARRFGKIGGRPFAAIVSTNAFLEQIPASGSVPLWNSCMTDESANFHFRIPRPYKIFSRHPKIDHSLLPSSRERKAVFRGSLSSYDRAQRSFNASSSWRDACITKVPSEAPCEYQRSRWCPGAPARWVTQFNIPTCHRLSLSEQIRRFKFVLSVDGVGCADRLDDLLHRGACIIKQQSPFKEYWYNILEPGRHYVDVNRALKDIDQTILDETTTGNCTRMSAAAIDFAQQYLTPERHVDHLAHTANAYSASLSTSPNTNLTIMKADFELKC